LNELAGAGFQSSLRDETGCCCQTTGLIPWLPSSHRSAMGCQLLTRAGGLGCYSHCRNSVPDGPIYGQR
jgi:hypothetical protein